MINLCYRTAYRCAYQLMRVYWTLTKPETHGALVALWWQGKILLVRNSYVSYYSLPGGYVRKSETGRAAAVRELKEEISLSVSEDALIAVLDKQRDWHGKRDRVELFQLTVDNSPCVAIDNREVVAAEFFTPEAALKLDLFPAIREHIDARLAQGDFGAQ